MSAPLILRADEGAVAVVILNDPAKLNALSTPMLNALATEFEALAADSAVRVVVIRAMGKAFCAGHDLKEIQAARQAHDGGAAAFGDLFSLCSRIMQQIASLPKPVIAEVQGIATAAGCQLAATCDMVVSSDHARFGVNGVNIGLFCSTPIVALSRRGLVPHHHPPAPIPTPASPPATSATCSASLSTAPCRRPKRPSAASAIMNNSSCMAVLMASV